MSSAQYINAGLLYRYLVQRRMETGYVVPMHPKAHTLVATWMSVLEFGGSLVYSQYLKSVVAQTSTLRCIAIENAKFRYPDYEHPLGNWSILTHLSTRTMIIGLGTWFSFIHSLCALQSGSFRLHLQEGDVANYIHPSITTLRCLKVLHIDVALHQKRSKQYPLKAVFNNLRLPALRTLSLKSRAETWYDCTALTELHAALASAPALATLCLGTRFLGGQGRYGDTRVSEPLRNGITPPAKWAPRFTRLTFALETPLRWESVFQFVDVVFGQRLDFDLKHPASAVQEVTFLASDTDIHSQGPLLISEVRKFVKDEVVVRFEEEGGAQAGRAVWAW